MITFEAASFEQLERLLGLVDRMEPHTIVALTAWATLNYDSIFKVIYLDHIMNNLEGV